MVNTGRSVRLGVVDGVFLSTEKGPFVNERMISRQRWMECLSWNGQRWMEISQTNGSPTVDCFVIDGKGTFPQQKNDFLSMVDGVFVLESLKENGDFADRWLANSGLLCD